MESMESDSEWLEYPFPSNPNSSDRTTTTTTTTVHRLPPPRLAAVYVDATVEDETMVVMRDYLPSFVDSSPRRPISSYFGSLRRSGAFVFLAGRQTLLNFVPAVGINNSLILSLYRLAPFCFFVSANIYIYINYMEYNLIIRSFWFLFLFFFFV